MPPQRKNARKLIRLIDELSSRVDRLQFADPVTHVYNPLAYARKAVENYLRRFTPDACENIFLGMNPGPWGMAQTGVPFGEVNLVRDWLGIRGKIERPDPEHPKRPVTGLECTRSEVSGARFWGWIRERCGEPESFFEHNFVWNWCPLSFMEEGGRNRTPDKLPIAERRKLEAICDDALAQVCSILQPKTAIGIGKFAAKRIERAIDDEDLRVVDIPHPSPASPAANKGWTALVDKRIGELGLDLHLQPTA